MIKLTFQDLLNEFTNSCSLPKRSRQSYISNLKRLDSLNGNQTAVWLNDVINNIKHSQSPLVDAIAKFNQWKATFPNPPANIGDLGSAYSYLAVVIIGFFDANVWAYLRKSGNIDEMLCQIVAQNAIFASSDVVNLVRKGLLGTNNNKGKGNPYASWDNMTSVRRVSVKKGTIVVIPLNINGQVTTFTCKTDDNTKANLFIKKAVLISKGLDKKGATTDLLKNYEACHVWDSPGDPRYYVSIANLVLLPRAFGQLTDHCSAVQEMLRYEVFKRFGFCPDGTPIPSKPKYYNKIVWRY